MTPACPDSPEASRSRPRSAVDELADRFVADYCAIDPLMATGLGIRDYDDRLPELTPEWLQSRSALLRATLGELGRVQPHDAVDRVTVAALREQLEVSEQLRAAGTEESDLNNIASPLQGLRQAFDLMPTATDADWAVVARRLVAVPGAIDGYIESLRLGASRGDVSARRQVRAGITQCDQVSGPDGFFARFAQGAAPTEGSLPEALSRQVTAASREAADAYDHLAGFLRTELLDQAPETDAVGRGRYSLHSRWFLGTVIDIDETYAWGKEELARITAEMAATADRIKPGASVREAMDHLDSEGSRNLHGTDALRAWMQEKSDSAVAALAGTHFDIPAPIRTLECRIAPTASGGIYYTGPSEDLVTRPGRMWWAVPDGVTEFSTWRELTTVYHEGVPGHHLQIAQTTYRRELLNRFRRSMSWVSGHGEGWALYAERLMADLGFLDDPADYLGMLDAQSLRAARVVLDIGLHCGLEAPAELGGGAWDYDKAWRFLSEHAAMAEGFLRFELERYLGWPGQAPAYKVGERQWLQLREDAKAKEAGAFELTAFHRRALDIGSVGLDVLRAAVLGQV